MLAPIILFVYNRPWHTQQTLDALAKNDLAKESILYIYADGAKENATQQDLQKIDEARGIISAFEGCKETHIVTRDKNWGLADNIIDGVTKIVNQYGKIIVLEDDILTSVGFLKYMNDALDLYQNEERVMHISGYMFPVKKELPSTFFYNTASCWGWATWAISWANFNPNSKELLEQINSQNLRKKFNVEDTYDFYGHLEANVNKQMKTWAVRWYASFFLKNGYALHPYPSLTQNIGFDGDGENCGVSDAFKWKSLTHSIALKAENIIESREAIAAMKKFNLLNTTTKNTFMASVKNKLSPFLPKKLKQTYNFIRHQDYRDSYNKQQEINRLKKLPRYEEGNTDALFQKTVYFKDSASFSFIYDEIFEKEIYKFKSKTKTPYIIDAGANIGLGVIYFKQLYPNAEIVAFEPDEKVFETLEKNVISFDLNNVQLIKKGLWNEETTLRFHSEGADAGRLAIETDTQEIVEIQTIRLREFLNKPVDMLKIDIEGAETKVLEDCKDLLHNVQYLFVEYHSFINQEQELHKLLNILNGAGFRYNIQHIGILSQTPFVEINSFLEMDLQLNIFAYR